MFFPVRSLIGSRRRLLLAVLLFIVLDLSVLVINLWIAHWVERDTAAINLAGRQRMLSQRVTKAAILATNVLPQSSPAEAFQELQESFQLFDNTLQAFQKGGMVAGGNHQLVQLYPVRSPQGQGLITQTLVLLQPVTDEMQRLSRQAQPPKQSLVFVRDYMVTHNQDVLSKMNELTTVLEQESVNRISDLRRVQIGAFFLALLNFVAIVWTLLKQYQSVEQERAHWHLTAQRDALTGLFNRRAFQSQLNEALEQAQQTGQTLVLFVVDLDNFKPINDTYGHALGDEVLRAFAQALLAVARKSDTVARLGGDEFAVVCPGMKDESAISDFCLRFFKGLDALQAPFHHIEIRASVGVALYPQHGQDAQTLMNGADAAMYLSKKRGGQCHVMAQPGHESQATQSGG